MADIEIIKGADNGNPPDTLPVFYSKTNDNMTNVNNQVINHEGRIDTAEAAVSDHGVRIAEAETELVNQDARITNIVAGAGESNTEIVDARQPAIGSAFPILGDRLNSVDAQLAETAEELELKATKLELINGLAPKADQAYVDTQFANIVSGSPKGTYTTLEALQAALPTGAEGTFLVLADGNWYFWNGTAWESGGVYQSTDIAPNSIGTDKLSFVPAKATTSKNLFNKAAVLAGKYIAYQNGTESINASNSASDWIPVLPSAQYSKVTSGQLAFYTSAKVYISGIASSVSFTTPSNAAYVRLTVTTILLDIEQLELGAATAYESFTPKIDMIQIKDRIVTESKLSFTPVKAVISKNLFNKATFISGKYISYLNGTEATGADYKATDWIPVLPSTQYAKNSSRQIAFYTSEKVYISGLASATTFTTPANAAYMRTSVMVTTTVDELTWGQLEIGSVSTPYVDYGSAIDKAYLSYQIQNDAGNDDFKLELPDNIYLVSGESFSIYYYNIIKNSQRFRKGNYYVTHILQGASVSVKKGVGYPYKWEYTPITSETFSIEFAIYETYTSRKVASKIVAFTVIDSALSANHGRTANIVTIGDSFVDGSGVSGQLYEFITTKGGINNVNMIGTRPSSNPSAFDDAISGFGYRGFYSAATGVAGTNAFYNPSTSLFDFAYYISTHFPTYTPSTGVGPHIDAFLSIMGLNDAIWGPDFSVSEYQTYVQYIINSVHAWDPEIKILLSAVTPQGVDDFYLSGDGGYPNNGVSSERAKHLQEKWNEMMLGYHNPSNKIYVIPTNAHFDSRFGTNTVTVYPDKFNPTYSEVVTFDIHPNATGAKYIADAYYQAIYNLVLHA